MNNTRRDPKLYFRAMKTLSIGFFWLFFAFSTIQAYQSQINKHEGYVSLSILYFSFTIFCLLGPKFVKLLDLKWCMIIGAVPYIVVISCNIHIIEELYYFINFTAGFGAAILWTAQGAYLVRCAHYYSECTGVSKPKSLNSNGYINILI